MKPETSSRHGHPRTLVVGIGNPIMGDDGVGIHVLRRLRDATSSPHKDLEFKELGIGGIKLVEEILDYENVFIIDAIESVTTIGDINEFSPEQFKSTYHETAPHDVNFITALEFYRKMQPHRIPKTIRIFTISIKNEFDFKERLSPPIQQAAERLIVLLSDEISRTPHPNR